MIDFHSTIAKYSKKYSSPMFGGERHRHYLCGVKIVRGYRFKKMVIEIKKISHKGMVSACERGMKMYVLFRGLRFFAFAQNDKGGPNDNRTQNSSTQNSNESNLGSEILRDAQNDISP